MASRTNRVFANENAEAGKGKGALPLRSALANISNRVTVVPAAHGDKPRLLAGPIKRVAQTAAAPTQPTQANLGQPRPSHSRASSLPVALPMSLSVGVSSLSVNEPSSSSSTGSTKDGLDDTVVERDLGEGAGAGAEAESKLAEFLAEDDGDLLDLCEPEDVYIQNILAHYRKSEARRHPSPAYMARQTDLNARMREVLVDWLVDIHYKYNMHRETLFLAVHVVDRFLEKRLVQRPKLQLVGCVALLIASKYEEIYVPAIKDIIAATEPPVSRDNILAMEVVMLQNLGFNLTVPLPLRFAERYLKVANVDGMTRYLCMFLLESTLQDLRFLKWLPSHVAAAATLLAVSLGSRMPWALVLQAETGYSEAELRECAKLMWEFATTPNKLNAVRRKYESRRFQQVALQVKLRHTATAANTANTANTAASAATASARTSN